MRDVVTTRWLKHPPEKVWRALSEPSIVRRWLPFEGYRPIVGHDFVAHGPLGVAYCEVLVVEAPSRVEILWLEGEVETRVRITLAEERGGTRLELRHCDLPERCYSPFLTAWSTYSASLQTALVPLSTFATLGLGVALSTIVVAGLGLAWWGGPPPTSPVGPSTAQEPIERLPTDAEPTKTEPAEPSSRDDLEPAEPPSDFRATASLPRIEWDGEEVEVLERALPTTLHPLFPRTEVDHRVHTLLFDRLFHRSAITNELKSRVVAQVEHIGSDLRLGLREDVRFHDGSPLTASDVCFSIEAALDPATTVSIAGRGVLGCTATDPSHALIRFESVLAEPRARIAVPLVPAHAFTGPPRPDDAFGNTPIGSGPYRPRAGRRALRLVPAGVPHHPVQLGALSVAGGSDPPVQVRLLEGGHVQGIVVVQPQHLGPIRASDHLAVKSFDPRSALYLALPGRLPLELRQAIDASLDREGLHYMTHGSSMLPGAHELSGPWLPSSPHYDRSVALPKADPQRVKAAMRTYGAELVQGRWTKNGQPIVLRLGAEPLDRPVPRTLLEELQKALRTAGFTVRPADHPNQADLWLVRHTWGVFEQADELVAGGPYPTASTEVRALLEAMRRAPTDVERQDAAHALHARVAEEKRVLPLFPERLKSAWTVEVRGNTISPSTYWDEVGSWHSR